MQKSALIIIDLQAFIKRLVKKCEPYGWETIIQNNRELIAHFDEQNLPVYLVTVEPKVLWKSARKAFSRMILQDELDKNPRLHKLVKSGPSAFKNSDYGLVAELKSQGIENIFVSGVSLENGVIKTARDGVAEGFKAYVITDASGSHNKANFEQAVCEVSKFGQIINTADITREAGQNG